MHGLEYNSQQFDLWFDDEHTEEEGVDEVWHDNYDEPFDEI